MLYAIGDIHGFYDELERALALIADDGGSDAPHVFVGDLVDRGPNSRKVIETLMSAQCAGKDWTVLFGNHDRMFLNYVRDGVEHDAAIKSGKSWLHPALGGPQTLASYGVSANESSDRTALLAATRAAVPEGHMEWIASLPRWHETSGHLFVHAGIRPGIAIDKQAEDDLIWIRDGWLEDTRDHGALVVHGHTALDHPTHEGNRLNIDGGTGYGRPLVPTVFDGENWYTLTDNGRELLWPSS